MPGGAVIREEGVEEWTENTALRSTCAEDKCGGEVSANSHCLWSVSEEVQNPAAYGLLQAQGGELGEQFGGDYGVEC